MNQLDVKASDSVGIRKRAGLALSVCSFLLVFGSVLHAEGRITKRRVAPVYPEIAKTMHIEGVVTVNATVNAGGDVVSVKAEGGNKLLSLAAEEAVKKWKFEPGSDQTIERVAVVFKLGD